MKKVLKILVLIALATMCLNSCASRKKRAAQAELTKKTEEAKQADLAAQGPVVPILSVSDEQRTNGFMFNPNGIAMIYVEGNDKINGFFIGKFEVTQRAWKAVMGKYPGLYSVSDNHPVSSMRDDIQTFIEKLNELTGRNYRLPTEAEWEYAAKGGNLSQGYRYSGGNNINDVAWYKKNSKYRPKQKVKTNTSKETIVLKTGTHKVGSKKPNELGIHDMTGNVWEVCSDCFNRDCKQRVARGGSYSSKEKMNSLVFRTGEGIANSYGGVGFRLVLE